MNIIEQIVPRNFVSVFKGRIDRVTLYPSSVKRIVSQQVQKGEFELVERVKAHIAGTTRMAFYNMLEDNTVPWAVVNFIEGETSENVEKDSILLAKELRTLGLRGVRRERTMNPKLEFNVWIFFATPVSAKKIRFFLYSLFEKLGLSKKLPVIPTTDELVPGSCGQYVWLPYFNGIDKWLDEERNAYVCKGVKDNQTVFLDDEGKPLAKNVIDIPRNSELDLDLALEAVTGNLGEKYFPGLGLKVSKNSLENLFSCCAAYSNIIKDIEGSDTMSEQDLLHLAVLMRNIGLNQEFDELKDKLTALDVRKFEKLYETCTNSTFPTCYDLKKAELCPVDMNCFQKRAPIVERMGVWKEDGKAEKTLEPTPALHYLKGLENSATSTGKEKTKTPDTTQGTTTEQQISQPGSSTIFAPDIRDFDVIRIDENIDKFEKILHRIREDYAAEPKTFPGFSTGSETFDDALEGIKPGSLVALFGPPGAGKSAFAKQLQDTIADKAKVPTLYISYDMSAEELYKRTLARLSGVPMMAILKGDINEENWQKIVRVNKVLKEQMKNLVHVLEADDGIPLPGIKNAIEKTKARFVVVDYIQALPELLIYKGDREIQEEIILNKLRQIARNTGAAIFAVSNSSLTRQSQYSADIILQMNQQVNPQIASSEKQPYAVIINVEKNRDGKSMVSIQYTFFPPRMIYYNEKKIDYRPLKF